MPVCVAAVRDAHHQDYQIVVPHLVEHSIVADTQPPETPEVAFQSAAEEWVVR